MGKRVKRAIDLMGAAVSLVATAPIMLVVAVLIRIRMGSPVFFRQSRPGYKGVPFELIKFRTMQNKLDESGNPLPDAERLTRLGRFLRSSSLDELPQLWNVLRGEMSLVGPRPLLDRYYPYFSEREKVRFLMRPGITGWAQVNGRNLTDWDERLAQDVWYVENWSLLLDLRILFLTIVKIARRSDVVTDPQSSLPNLDEARSLERSKGG